MPAFFRHARPSRPRSGPATPIIYLAGPCAGTTGGMYQVSVYLLQASREAGLAAAQLRLLDTRGPGAAIASSFYAAGAALRIAQARLTGRLAGVHIHVAERLSLVRKGLLVGLCRLLRVPVVLHLHAAELEQGYAALARPLRALVRALFRAPDCCIALGQGAARFLEAELGVPQRKIEVVTNGVPEPSAARGGARSDGCFHVLFVGNLSERKGVPVLLQALADPRLRDLPMRVTLVGRGDIAGYEQLARTLGVQDRVHFAGWDDKAGIDRRLAASDAFVLPSFHEGLPLAILEALAAGVPVVCTPVGEIPKVLDHGRTAQFVEPGNPGALAEALLSLAHDAGRRQALGQGGRSAYEACFSLAAFARAIGAIHLQHFGVSALAAEPSAPRGASQPDVTALPDALDTEGYDSDWPAWTQA